VSVAEPVKCLVWDLDNTLWQGTLAEDGEVVLPDAHRAVVQELDARGILQSIASRNDPDRAWARLRELGIAEYFVLPQISWGPKSEAVRTIADRLGFALPSIAFIDDHPAERAEVSHHLPDVRCYPAAQATSLVDRPELTPATVTVDARRRRTMYQAGFRRATARVEFPGPDEEFLRTLDLCLWIRHATDEDLTRVEELTLRTSQMNATGVHYPDPVLRRMRADPAHEVLVATMTDRFGPHGAIGVVLLARQAGALSGAGAGPRGSGAGPGDGPGGCPGTWHLKLLATSCRVVPFGAGAVILGWLTDQAAVAGVHLVADFARTDRNRMMEVTYRFAGFGEESCRCLAALPPAGTPGVQRLHLTPTRQPPPATMQVAAPDLAGEPAWAAHGGGDA
jgi:methoxymalonate biosynthesis protein